MAVWTPGSYMVREFSRHVEGVPGKIAKNRWRVAAGADGTVSFRYRVYCHEASVRTNWVDEGSAFLNGAATFIGVVGRTAQEHEVTIILPSAWGQVVTALPEHGGVFRAPDFDTLVDSPILAGNPARYAFTVNGVAHLLANEGEDGVWDGPRSQADLQRIVEYHLRMWGSLPYPHFTFLNLMNEAYGGLEHRNSLAVMTSRWATRTRTAYLKWLFLMSHEHFHVWNVKRLRPIELGPFDYENENYTRSLWIAEGFTEYYGSLNIRRAGLCSNEEYLVELSTLIERLQKTPGRLHQSVAEASVDAWIRLYRPDENTVNSTISYYTKGAVIAWLLDALIRRATDNVKTLDDLMRLAYRDFSDTRGFTAAQFQALAAGTAGIDLSAWFHHATETVEELKYSEALNWFGLRFRTPEVPPRSSLGFGTKAEDGRLVVTQVPEGGPAFTAGFSPGDEILATDGFRVRHDQWPQRMEQYRAGETIRVLIARRDRILHLDAVLEGETTSLFRLERLPGATEAQCRNLAIWLEPASSASVPGRAP